jgi:hypothetical protein
VCEQVKITWSQVRTIGRMGKKHSRRSKQVVRVCSRSSF